MTYNDVSITKIEIPNTVKMNYFRLNEEDYFYKYSYSFFLEFKKFGCRF